MMHAGQTVMAGVASGRIALLLISAALGALFALAAFSPGAFAASTVDTFTFESQELEERYRQLIAEIRCPMCQNVNIAGSDAPIAKDLRVTVHRLLGEGQSNAQILDFLQARYGDFVLYDPPMRANTILLWLVPLFGFLLVGWIVLRMARRRVGASGAGVAVLSPEEVSSLNELLGSELPGDRPPADSRDES